MLSIEEHKVGIDRICKKYPVKSLALFGWALTDRFDEPSDVDVLVDFDDGNDIDYFGIYFRLKESLEEEFNRSVDLVVDRPFRNPIFQKLVNRSRMTVYERRSA